ncbi:glutathione-S-transferase/glutaredoxin [Angomonas deanei]|nr:glutathione-S-transferase/glutaredoxin [Angomonas deanei]|eukprot:EPY31629.1 glutathione-S-transferase/glutaredoxin [Angomonas deanei]
MSLKGLGKKLFIGGSAVGVLALGGGYATYQRRLKENRSMSAEAFNSQQDSSKVAWSLAHLTTKDSGLLPKLYRYTTCPWCGTVKSFLDCNNVNHECVEVEPMLKGELKESAYKKVPQLRFDVNGEKGPYLVDSKVIVDTLAQQLGYGKQLSDEEVQRWREWARGPLVRLMTLEFNKSLIDAWSGYSYIDKCDTIPTWNKWFLKVVGAPVMYLVALKITRPNLIKDGYMKEGDVPSVQFNAQLKRFAEEALVDPKTKKAKVFHGGNKPDLADMDTFGVLQAVRGHRIYDEIIMKSDLSSWLKEWTKLREMPLMESRNDPTISRTYLGF